MIALWRFFAVEKRNLSPSERRALLNGSWLAAMLVQFVLTLYAVLNNPPAGMTLAAGVLVVGLAVLMIALIYYAALWLCYGWLANFYARRLFGS